jgi:hypothetical protein
MDNDSSEIRRIEEQAITVSNTEIDSETAIADEATISTEMRQARVLFDKCDELDRMIAYVKNNGIDRSFLHLCNHDDVLSNLLRVQLPACESFTEQGCPSSAESVAALESFASVLAHVWERVKRFFLRLKDWIIKLIHLWGFRISRGLSKCAKLKVEMTSCKGTASTEMIDFSPDVHLGLFRLPHPNFDVQIIQEATDIANFVDRIKDQYHDPFDEMTTNLQQLSPADQDKINELVANAEETYRDAVDERKKHLHEGAERFLRSAKDVELKHVREIVEGCKVRLEFADNVINQKIPQLRKIVQDLATTFAKDGMKSYTVGRQVGKAVNLLISACQKTIGFVISDANSDLSAIERWVQLCKKEPRLEPIIM